MIIVLTIGSICWSLSTQHVLDCAAINFAEESICVVCFVFCVVCICVVAQIKISHEADAVPIRIKKPNHRSSVAQMRLQRHTAEYRKQNIPKALLVLVPALLDFPIHLTHVNTACNTRCLPLILQLYSPWYFWMHSMVAFSPLLCNISHPFQWTYY